MSFFGLDPSGGHNKAAPGFSQAHDAFAGLSNRDDDGDALEFEDTYDGLGDQLDETDDAFNDATFGGGGDAPSSGAVGRDFDFFGQTAKVSTAIEEEQLRFHRHPPAAKPAPQPAAYTSANSYYYGASAPEKPLRSGYEKYKEPEPDLQVDAALWGVAPRKTVQTQPAPPAQPSQPAAGGRKMMSLEEVEAAMRAQAKPAQPVLAPQSTQAAQQLPQPTQPHMHHQQPQVPDPRAEFQYGGPEPAPAQTGLPADNGRGKEPVQHHGHGHPVTILQRPQSKPAQTSSAGRGHGQAIPQQQQLQNQANAMQHQQARQHTSAMVQPTQILQNPNRLSGDAARIGVPTHPIHHRQHSSFSQQAQMIPHPSQVAHLSEAEKSTYMEQEAKRAKRNHKIFLLSKDNGIMTPQDKNFVTRIQLQQLVSATGNPNEHGTDHSINEDFYYQVHNQIRGGHRQNPSQPLNNFAQTYLYQTGSRQVGMRRHHRGPENHMQRMEQQVQRAVEAAKSKPKNKQLVIEGSLGKISFSNAKTPKPLLNIKRTDSGAENLRPGSAHKAMQGHGMDRKAVLRDIERVYSTLMQLEDHDRKTPSPVGADEDLDLMQLHVEWQEESQRLNAQLWRELKVHEPIGETPVHPFIAFLSFSKGKKAIPRVFRYTTQEQRTTILTMIVFHLDQLDVVRSAQINAEPPMNAAMRENVELFQLSVMNSLFNFMNEVELDIASGVLGLVTNLNVDLIAKTRIGTSMLTMILSRAAIIKHAGGGNPQGWQTWEHCYTNFFNKLESSLPYIFPGTVTAGDDMYVWQLLAALGIGASPDQQQRLVLAVKDRVMDTVAVSKTLPADLSASRLQSVNLFMHSIGLDVELLQ